MDPISRINMSIFNRGPYTHHCPFFLSLVFSSPPISLFPYSNRQEEVQVKTVKTGKRLLKRGELKKDAETSYPSDWGFYRDRYTAGPWGGRALGVTVHPSTEAAWWGAFEGSLPLKNVESSFITRKWQSSVERPLFKQYQKGKMKCTWSNRTQYRYITITIQLAGIQDPKITLYSKYKYLKLLGRWF